MRLSASPSAATGCGPRLPWTSSAAGVDGAWAQLDHCAQLLAGLHARTVGIVSAQVPQSCDITSAAYDMGVEAVNQRVSEAMKVIPRPLHCRQVDVCALLELVGKNILAFCPACFADYGRWLTSGILCLPVGWAYQGKRDYAGEDGINLQSNWRSTAPQHTLELGRK